MRGKRRKDRRDPKCPSKDGWIKKRWYIHAMEYYLALRKKKILSLATTWINLEDNIHCDISQIRKDKCCMISLG